MAKRRKGQLLIVESPREEQQVQTQDITGELAFLLEGERKDAIEEEKYLRHIRMQAAPRGGDSKTAKIMRKVEEYPDKDVVEEKW